MGTSQGGSYAEATIHPITEHPHARRNVVRLSAEAQGSKRAFQRRAKQKQPKTGLAAHQLHTAAPAIFKNNPKALHQLSHISSTALIGIQTSLTEAL